MRKRADELLNVTPKRGIYTPSCEAGMALGIFMDIYMEIKVMCIN